MGQTIYLDTNLYIYLFENNPKFSSQVEKLLSLNHTVIASPLLITELLVGPIRDHNDALVRAYTRLTQSMDHLQIIDFSSEIAIQAAHLRGKYNLATPDSIHLATAVHAQCSRYYTHNKQLTRVKEIMVQVLQERKGED